MIEILLALTVVAVGMTSILGLFPVGLNASRNAIAQNMSADVADQMTTYLRVINESSPTTYTANIGTSGTYQTTPYSDEDVIKAQSEAFLTAYKSGDVSTGSTAYPRVAADWAIFKNLAGAGGALEHQMFFVVQGPNCTKDGGNRSIDFSAMVLIWKSQVQIRRLDASSNWTLWSPAYDISGMINIELSWPLELPYNERKKRCYQVVITKPNS
ncbi:MAG: hypothetical protein PHV82_16920 [Victivallaceae bacterium]|nr:hypothetical protein [Victivallaceae bacterium]